MSIYLHTHIVKKGETLEEIAALYHIPDVKMLFRFHHRHVPKDKNHLGKVLHEGQEIFIPNEDDIKEFLEDRRKSIHRYFERRWHTLQNRTFNFPFKEGRYRYQVTIKDAEPKNNYTISLLLECFKKNEAGLYPLRIHQSEVKCNNTLPDLSVEIVSSALSQIIFPLEIYVNNKGLIKDVHKSYALKEKWNLKKPELYEIFEGEIGKRLIDQISYKIADVGLVTQYLNLNMLWAILLRGRMGIYENGICEKEMQLLNDYEGFYVKNIMLKNEDMSSEHYCITQEIRKKDGSDFRFSIKYKQDIDYDRLERVEADLYNGNENINIIIIKTPI